MTSHVLSRYPPGSWRGFLLRVAVIAVAALIVLGIADWFGISLDPLGLGPRKVARPATRQGYARPSIALEP